MRTLFGAVTAVLLGVIAYLLYCNYIPGYKPIERPIDEPAELMPPQQQPRAEPVPAPAPMPTPAPAPVPPRAQPTPVPTPPPTADAPGKKTHIVQPGESLWVIAKAHYGNGDLYSKIAEANKLRKGEHIRAGQVLVIPPIAGTKPQPVIQSRVEETVPPSTSAPIVEEAETPAEGPAEQPSKETGNEEAAGTFEIPPTLSVPVPLSK
jgi:LysM repeat protein